MTWHGRPRVTPRAARWFPDEVTRGNVCAIIHGKTWRGVEPSEPRTPNTVVFGGGRPGHAAGHENLYDDLAPEDRRVGSGPHGHFVERAVRFEGTTYALQYNAEQYEPGTCIIATVRDAVAFDLDSAPQGAPDSDNRSTIIKLY